MKKLVFTLLIIISISATASAKVKYCNAGHRASGLEMFGIQGPSTWVPCNSIPRPPRHPIYCGPESKCFEDYCHQSGGTIDQSTGSCRNLG